jgi:hypothetical protein
MDRWMYLVTAVCFLSAGCAPTAAGGIIVKESPQVSSSRPLGPYERLYPGQLATAGEAIFHAIAVSLDVWATDEQRDARVADVERAFRIVEDYLLAYGRLPNRTPLITSGPATRPTDCGLGRGITPPRLVAAARGVYYALSVSLNAADDARKGDEALLWLETSHYFLKRMLQDYRRLPEGPDDGMFPSLKHPDPRVRDHTRSVLEQMGKSGCGGP